LEVSLVLDVANVFYPSLILLSDSSFLIARAFSVSFSLFSDTWESFFDILYGSTSPLSSGLNSGVGSSDSASLSLDLSFVTNKEDGLDPP